MLRLRRALRLEPLKTPKRRNAPHVTLGYEVSRSWGLTSDQNSQLNTLPRHWYRLRLAIAPLPSSQRERVQTSLRELCRDLPRAHAGLQPGFQHRCNGECFRWRGLRIPRGYCRPAEGHPHRFAANHCRKLVLGPCRYRKRLGLACCLHLLRPWRLLCSLVKQLAMPQKLVSRFTSTLEQHDPQPSTT